MTYERNNHFIFFTTIHSVSAETRIDKIKTNEECLFYVDSLIQINKRELSYFKATLFKEIADRDFLVPELRKYISTSSLIGWEKFDLNQDGNMDLYFSISDVDYESVQGFVIGDKKQNSNQIYLFDQFESTTFANPVFQLQEKTGKKNQILNYRYTASGSNSCTKIISTRLSLHVGDHLSYLVTTQSAVVPSANSPVLYDAQQPYEVFKNLMVLSLTKPCSVTQSSWHDIKSYV